MVPVNKGHITRNSRSGPFKWSLEGRRYTTQEPGTYFGKRESILVSKVCKQGQLAIVESTCLVIACCSCAISIGLVTYQCINQHATFKGTEWCETSTLDSFDRWLVACSLLNIMPHITHCCPVQLFSSFYWYPSIIRIEYLDLWYICFTV